MNSLLQKLGSGRFLFTMIAAIVFCYCAIRQIMPIDKVHEIILIVVYAYFSRQDRGNGTPKST